MTYCGPLQERNVQRGGKAGPSAPSQAPRLKAAATAAGSKRPTRPVSPDLRTSKRQRASAAGPLPQEQDEWKPLALMVAQFEAATPARFNNAGPRAVHYVPPPPPHPSDKARRSP
ncbi:g3865 [Coccomyxa elongata]